MRKEHYTITLQDGSLQWLLHFDSYLKWIVAEVLMRAVLRLCSAQPAPQQALEETGDFPEYIEELKDPTEGYELVRFVEGASIDLDTLAEDEMTLPKPPDGWRVYKRKSS